MKLYHHIFAFSIGYILDIMVGDPHGLPHPVRWIGALISKLETMLLREDMSEDKKKKNGRLLVLNVLLITVGSVALILIGSYLVNIYLGMIVEAVLTYYIFATKSLKDESMKVHSELVSGDTDRARYMLSMIVGRDTDKLDERAIAQAAIETVAENTSDGVIAPMIYTAIGGPLLGFFYKAVNTMDSMIGYKNDRYMDFGRCAARLDDVVNYLPARLSAAYMISASYILEAAASKTVQDKDGNVTKIYSGKRAYRIYKRDRYNHKSPNSAHTESVCAGALGLRLAGPSSYFGKRVEKPYIGDDTRTVEPQDIVRANKLMYITSVTGFLSLLLILCIIYFSFI